MTFNEHILKQRDPPLPSILAVKCLSNIIVPLMSHPEGFSKSYAETMLAHSHVSLLIYQEGRSQVSHACLSM